MSEEKKNPNKENDPKVKKGEELIAVLKEVLEDDAKILENQDLIMQKQDLIMQKLDCLSDMTRAALPPHPGRFTRA